jgi:oligopeptide transport system substrate-binding protein
MQNRLRAVLVCIALIAATCDSATISEAPSPNTEPGTFAEASAAADSNLAAEQILRVNIGAEPDALDPTALGGPEILRALQRPLIEFDRNGTIVPALAESWDISDDAETLTFHLRQARYSNGDPIVAADFVYSARRLADPRTAAGYSYVMAQVVGGPELLALAREDPSASDTEIEAALDNLGVNAPDNVTVVVHLLRPSPTFLSDLTLWFFVPLQQAWITSPHATEAGSFVSSGPFILDTWEHGSLIVLKPNPYWWGEVKPTLTEIQMSVLGTAEAQLAYEVHEIDIVKVPEADVRRVKSDPVLSAEYREAPALAVNFYNFNNFQDPAAASYGEPGPTANLDFRIALTQAINKQALIDSTYAGLGNVANSFIMPGIPGHQPDLNPYPYDLVSANEHMDRALTALSVRSAAELGELNLRFVAGFNNEARVAFLTEAWRQAFGLAIDQRGTDRGVFFDDRSSGRYDIALGAWGADYPEAGNQLKSLFPCGGGNNDAKYCNPAFDALIDRAATELDPSKQVAVYMDAETLLMEDAPILPLRFAVNAYAVKPYVSGLTEHPSDFRVPGDYSFETIKILEH